MTFSTRSLFLTVTLAGASAVLSANAASAARPTHAAAEVPLTGNAWRWADAAFVAYKRKDYPRANTLAAKALALRPDLSRLWLLRVYALQIVQDALAKGYRDPVLYNVRDNLLRALEPGVGSVGPITQTPAWKLADAAYKDYAADHYADAEHDARESLSLQLDNPALRSLLVHTLDREDKRVDAAREADAAQSACRTQHSHRRRTSVTCYSRRKSSTGAHRWSGCATAARWKCIVALTRRSTTAPAARPACRPSKAYSGHAGNRSAARTSCSQSNALCRSAPTAAATGYCAARGPTAPVADYVWTRQLAVLASLRGRRLLRPASADAR